VEVRGDHGHGVTADSTGNGLTGTPNGTLTQGAAGKIGKGITFTDGAVVVKSNPLLDFKTAGTIEFWFNPGSTTAIGQMVSRGTGMNDSNVLVHTSGDGGFQVIFTGKGSASVANCCAGLLSVGTWHHVAVVNDGTDMKLYVNADLKATKPGGKFEALTSDLWIGKRSNPVFALTGSLDEVKWWTVVRTAE
jgi:hypothetical protein